MSQTSYLFLTPFLGACSWWVFIYIYFFYVRHTSKMSLLFSFQLLFRVTRRQGFSAPSVPGRTFSLDSFRPSLLAAMGTGTSLSWATMSLQRLSATTHHLRLTYVLPVNIFTPSVGHPPFPLSYLCTSAFLHDWKCHRSSPAVINSLFI